MFTLTQMVFLAFNFLQSNLELSSLLYFSSLDSERSNFLAIDLQVSLALTILKFLLVTHNPRCSWFPWLHTFIFLFTLDRGSISQDESRDKRGGDESELHFLKRFIKLVFVMTYSDS